jgi:hypothetical protein
MNGGVLLCADREENDGVSKREIDKIYELKRRQGIIFIAGAGPSHVLRKFELACEQLVSEEANLPVEHVKLFEDLGGRAKPANEGRVKTGQRGMHSGH